MQKSAPIPTDQSIIAPHAGLRDAISALIHSGKYSLIIITLLTAVSSVMPALQVKAVAALVSSTLPSFTNSHHSTIAALTLLSITIICSYVSENLIKYLSNKLTLKLSFLTETQIIERLQSFEVQDFENAKTYDKIQRADSNTGLHIFELFNSTRSGLQAAISIIGIIVVIGSWNIWIAVALILAPIPAAVATFILQNRVFNIEFERAPMMRLANYFRGLLCSDSTRKEIRVFQLGHIFEERYVQMLKICRDQDLLLAKSAITKAGALGLVSALTNIAAIVLASLLAAETGRVGELAGFISGSIQMNTLVMTAFLGIIGSYQRLRYVSNWITLMETKPSTISQGVQELRGHDSDRNQCPGVTIEFRNVSFTYPGTDKTVLNNVSFYIEAGTTAALVGLNGSGKTTICKLLLRFYEPSNGSILVDGISITQYTRDSLYRIFSALFQDFSKFECSIGDNVAFGIGRSFDAINQGDKISSTLSLVGLEPLIKELPQGLHTTLGRRFDGGEQLSTGQWQRVAMARALYKEPKLLILDEPTASVDSVSEREIFRALRNVSEHLTILLVAHRVTTISHADHIIVLDDGEVVDSGSHNTLLASCELYKHICRTQQGDM